MLTARWQGGVLRRYPRRTPLELGDAIFSLSIGLRSCAICCSYWAHIVKKNALTVAVISASISGGIATGVVVDWPAIATPEAVATGEAMANFREEPRHFHDFSHTDRWTVTKNQKNQPSASSHRAAGARKGSAASTLGRSMHWCLASIAALACESKRMEEPTALRARQLKPAVCCAIPKSRLTSVITQSLSSSLFFNMLSSLCNSSTSFWSCSGDLGDANPAPRFRSIADLISSKVVTSANGCAKPGSAVPQHPGSTNPPPVKPASSPAR